MAFLQFRYLQVSESAIFPILLVHKHEEAKHISALSYIYLVCVEFQHYLTQEKVVSTHMDIKALYHWNTCVDFLWG